MPTLTQLSSNLTEIVIYAAIALVTLTGLCKCIYPLLRKRIASQPRGHQAGKEHRRGRAAHLAGGALFGQIAAQRVAAVSAQCRTAGYARHSLRYARIFNEETVVEKPGHAQLAELIPGLLTSLGILGTFIGLMQGLTNVDFSNAEGTIQSIPQLLSGMRFAFATSVAGISCSLLFNMFNRMSAGRAVRALDNF